MCRRARAAGAASVSCSTSAWRSVMACASARRSINTMSDFKALTERVDTLEARIAYQDDTIETLNQTITEQWAVIDALRRQLAVLSERLREAENQMPRSANEPPPHY